MHFVETWIRFLRILLIFFRCAWLRVRRRRNRTRRKTIPQAWDFLSLIYLDCQVESPAARGAAGAGGGVQEPPAYSLFSGASWPSNILAGTVCPRSSDPFYSMSRK